MDELLKMTGLTKVKNETIELFKSAITLKKMTPAAQEANPRTFNYCFLGNAVRFLANFEEIDLRNAES